LPLVVAGLGTVLAAAPPGRPSPQVPGITRRLDDQRAEETCDLVAGQRDLPRWWRWQACSLAALMDKNARASMARVVHRYRLPRLPGDLPGAGQRSGLLAVGSR
jgi:hypothetical protein